MSPVSKLTIGLFSQLKSALINSAFPLVCSSARKFVYARRRTVSLVLLLRAGRELLLTRRLRYRATGPLMLLVPPLEPKKHLVTS